MFEATLVWVREISDLDFPAAAIASKLFLPMRSVAPV